MLGVSGFSTKSAGVISGVRAVTGGDRLVLGLRFEIWGPSTTSTTSRVDFSSAKSRSAETPDNPCAQTHLPYSDQDPLALAIPIFLRSRPLLSLTLNKKIRF